MAEPTIFKCNGNSYVIADWDVEKSLEILVWITKTFGQSFLNLFLSGEALDILDAEMDGVVGEETKEKAEELISKVFMNLDPKEYVARTKAIVQGTLCNAKEINYNVHFRGKIGELHLLLFQILKHQYSDFLVGSGGGKTG